MEGAVVLARVHHEPIWMRTRAYVSPRTMIGRIAPISLNAPGCPGGTGVRGVPAGHTNVCTVQTVMAASCARQGKAGPGR
jgi:hypothetical protein